MDEGAAVEGKNESVDRDLMNAYATDALSVFRIGLLTISLYATVMAILFRTVSTDFVTRIGNSLYTIIGIQLLLGSMLAAVGLYVEIRLKSTRKVYRNRGILNDERMLAYSLGATALGSVLAVVSLLAGLLDGFGTGGVPAIQVSALFFPIILIIVLFDLLVLPELMKRWGTWAAEHITARRGGTGDQQDAEN
jgi:hypothetical protein